MYAFELFAGLLAAATIGSASPITNAEVANLEARQAAWKCPDLGKGFGGVDVVTAKDSKNGLCCITGWEYMGGENRATCCRNDPALLNDPTFQNALECNSKWWSSADNVILMRNCNIGFKARKCSPQCEKDGVPWLFPTPKSQECAA